MLYGLDLFSGIGGLTLALSPWVRPVAYCEIDAYCRAVLLSQISRGSLPLAPIWDDVCALRGDDVGSVDIVYGGFPCQDISVAGRGAGLAGERSGLFSEIARLVGELRPRFVFLENVPAIRTRGADAVVGRLASLGYDSRWGVLSAFDVGAPHLRERWWLLAHSRSHRLDIPDANSSRIRIEKQRKERRRNSLQDGRSPVAIDDGEKWALADPVGGRREARIALAEHQGQSQAALGCPGLADAYSERPPNWGRFGSGRRPESASGRWWSVEPDVGRVVDGLSRRVDRLRALGNSVVPAQAREAFARLLGVRAT